MVHRSLFNYVKRQPLVSAFGLALCLAAVSLIMHYGEPMSTSFHHLFYIVILAAAFFHGVVGGVAAGAAAGVLSGPWLPWTFPASASPDFVDGAVRFAVFVGVGLFTGMLTRSLNRRLRELNQLTDDSIRAFIRALDAMDGATARHSEQVAEYATAIARKLNLPPAQIDRVRWAALLHDVGKLSIPREILNKSGPLDDDEWAIVKRHPLESVRIVADVTQLHGLLPAVRHHHERVDGRGYPDGVQGVQFPLEARIISVADAFDAMTSHRPYRPALTPDEAYGELRRNVGTQFDPRVVAAFMRAHRRVGANGHNRSGENGQGRRPDSLAQ